jgi:hypothetical protein
MTENEIRNDFAGRLITRLQGMKMDGAARVVELTLEDVNTKEDDDDEDKYTEEDHEG